MYTLLEKLRIAASVGFVIFIAMPALVVFGLLSAGFDHLAHWFENLGDRAIRWSRSPRR